MDTTGTGDRRRMRIAFAAQPFDLLNPPVQGGSLAIWIHQVARVCANRGHDTVVFANHGPVFGSGSVRSEGVDYVYTPTGANRLLNKLSHATAGIPAGLRKRPILPGFASAWEDLIYAMEVGRRSRRMGCDIVHVMNYSQFVPVIRRLNPKAKICLHMECEWLTQLDPVVIEKRISHADLIIGCSEYITRKISHRFPQFEKRCVTVPNGALAVPETDRTGADPYAILFVGRVSPEKGIHDLIRAFHEVLKRFPKARLHIAGGFGSAPLELLVGLSDEPHVAGLRIFYESNGDGKKDPYLASLEKEAGEELGKRILFEGRIEHGQIDAHYKHTALLVNPSLSESFGMSLVEAMMHRIPVVATRVGGMITIVDHGRTGLLVEPADPRGLAAAICEILGDREKARRMGDAGRKKALEKFSWEKATDRLLGYFRAMVG